MGLIFDNFYDEAKWEKQMSEKDISGNIQYDKAQVIKCRHVGGSHIYKVNTDSIEKTYNDEYQVDPNIDIKEGDRLDCHLVLNVQPSKNIFGNNEFWIVKVE